MRARDFVWPLLVLLLALSVSEKHLWQANWRGGLSARYNCRTVSDTAGRRLAAWRWVEGREIRIYFPYLVPEWNRREIIAGVEGVVRDLGLELRVCPLPKTYRISCALEASTQRVDGVAHLDTERLCQALLATRDGRHAEIIIAPGILDGSPETQGVGYFAYGVVVLNQLAANGLLARHETGHLLGYHLHDNWPFIVAGYRSPWQPGHGPTRGRSLMMPELGESALSPRSRDALVSFWQGLEARTGQAFFAAR